jgi:uncharacterized protein with HEPN domain
MRSDERDAAALWDMSAYAQELVDTLGRIPFAAYLADKNLRLATERRLEIIGEAARGVSKEFRAAHPEIPWDKIIGLRHVLAHEYGEIKQEVLFRIATTHVPELISQLRPLIPPPPEGEET